MKKPDRTESEVPPPEPEFFDEPKRLFPKEVPVLGKFFRKKVFLWILVLLAPLILALIFFSPRREIRKAQSLSAGEEKRSVVSARSLDQAIESSRQKEEIPLEIGRKESQSAKERNYATAIAVAVQEKEEEKNSYLKNRSTEEEKLLGPPSGTKIPALLENRVFSFNVAAPVLAIVPKDFLWKDQVVIPQGSKFLGEASVLKSLDRINVSFDLLIFPDGMEKRVRAMALSSDGSSGIKGKVEKHRDVRVLKAIGETLLAGTTLFLGGRRTDPYSLEDQLRVNLAQNLASEARNDLRNIRVEKSVTAEAYTPILVILLEPL